MNNILYPVLELKLFLILMMAVIMLFGVLVFFAMGRTELRMNRFGWQMLFFGLRKRELFCIALTVSQLCLVIASAAPSSSVGIVQAAAFLFLCAAKALCAPSLAGILGDVFYTALMWAALSIGNLLSDYMKETGVEFYIGAIWVLLSLFTVQYSVYYFLKEIERLLRRHEERRGRTRNERKRSLHTSL